MPRYFNNGSAFTVQLTGADVQKWAQSWPCFGDARPVWFQYHKQSGDLVGCSDTAGIDESAVLALSHDAQIWGEFRQAGNVLPFGADIQQRANERS